MWISFWINLSISRLSENYPYFFSFYSWFSRVKSNFRKLDFLTSREIFCSSSSCPKYSLWIFLELFGNKNSFSFIYLFVFFLSFFFFLFLSFFTRRAHLFLSLPCAWVCSAQRCLAMCARESADDPTCCHWSLLKVLPSYRYTQPPIDSLWSLEPLFPE